MVVGKSKSKEADYDVQFAEEDIELLRTIATENLMEARALHNTPNITDTYLLDHQSRVIPFPRQNVPCFLEKLLTYAGRSQERAAREASFAPTAYAEDFRAYRLALGETALRLATELENKLAVVRAPDIEAEARKIIAGSAIDADKWLQTITQSPPS